MVGNDDNNEITRIYMDLIAESVDAESEIWMVYRLANQTLKEIYFGVTKDLEARIEQHAKGETKAIAHWNLKSDDIEKSVLHRDLTQAEASEIAHNYEAESDGQASDYKTISTAGI